LKKHLNNFNLSLFCLALIFGCQQTTSSPNNNISQKVTFPSPCKKATTPLIQNKEQLKKMLLKENKINSDMSPEEINKIINQYIKNKRSPKCKPTKQPIDKGDNTNA